MYAVPLLASSGAANCTKENPCIGDCNRCRAESNLSPDDWVAVLFYQRVRDQYDNLTPMGTEKGKPAFLTMRLEAVESALRMHRYPRALWGWLSDTAVVLHRLVHKLDRVRWYAETGKHYTEIEPEDVADGVE